MLIITKPRILLFIEIFITQNPFFKTARPLKLIMNILTSVLSSRFNRIIQLERLNSCDFAVLVEEITHPSTCTTYR